MTAAGDHFRQQRGLARRHLRRAGDRRVQLGGQALEVTPAWVVVAPPDYGPQRKSVRTMWDLMRDVAITAGMLTSPARPSFTNDILPVFQRVAGLQWVNAGFAAGFGWNGHGRPDPGPRPPVR